MTSGGDKLAYALGDLGSNFVWTFCASWLTLYYTDSMLVSAGLIGTIMLVLRLADGVSDIIFGPMIEKTHTRFGKARPWFGGSNIPLVVIQLFVRTPIYKVVETKPLKNFIGISLIIYNTLNSV